MSWTVEIKICWIFLTVRLNNTYMSKYLNFPQPVPTFHDNNTLVSLQMSVCSEANQGHGPNCAVSFQLVPGWPEKEESRHRSREECEALSSFLPFFFSFFLPYPCLARVHPSTLHTLSSTLHHSTSPLSSLSESLKQLMRIRWLQSLGILHPRKKERLSFMSIKWRLQNDFWMLWSQAAKRALFVLGLFSRYAFDMIEEGKIEGVTVEEISQMFKGYLKIGDTDLMTRALQVPLPLPLYQS